MMHISTIVGLVGLGLAALQGASGQRSPCRRSEEVSRCVDTPISTEQQQPLCLYRVCGFSYIGAEKCGAQFETRATHMCDSSTVTQEVWKCVPGSTHRSVLLPLGCDGDDCKDEQKGCPCRVENVERVVRLPQELITETCSNLNSQ